MCRGMEEGEHLCVNAFCAQISMCMCLIRRVENIVYNYGIADEFAIPMMIFSCSHE